MDLLCFRTRAIITGVIFSAIASRNKKSPESTFLELKKQSILCFYEPFYPHNNIFLSFQFTVNGVRGEDGKAVPSPVAQVGLVEKVGQG